MSGPVIVWIVLFSISMTLVAVDERRRLGG